MLVFPQIHAAIWLAELWEVLASQRESCPKVVLSNNTAIFGKKYELAEVFPVAVLTENYVLYL